MRNILVVGRILDGTRLIGYKVYDLSTLDFSFKRKDSLCINNCVNLKYSGKCIVSSWSTIKIKDLAVYDKFRKLKKKGLYTDSQAYSLRLNTDSVIYKICGALVSGVITDLYSIEANNHARLYYQEIRAMTSDVIKIASNTDFSISEIKRIKRYLFLDYHDLYNDGSLYQFEPDFAIAQSWQRLMSRNKSDILPHDLTLLRHELYELSLVNKGYNQDKAHNITEKLYNYQKESEEYYDKIKKH